MWFIFLIHTMNCVMDQICLYTLAVRKLKRVCLHQQYVHKITWHVFFIILTNTLTLLIFSVLFSLLITVNLFEFIDLFKNYLLKVCVNVGNAAMKKIHKQICINW